MKQDHRFNIQASSGKIALMHRHPISFCKGIKGCGHFDALWTKMFFRTMKVISMLLALHRFPIQTNLQGAICGGFS